jgi:AAA+ ATPase superfamily predicted ATPase
VVVLDEFPYLCEANKSVPSQIQRFWDTKGKSSSLMLVLCGSQVSFMEKEVLAERSPLFGRRTAQRRLEPLAPLETLSFFPRWPLSERVLAYAVLGGMPAYLQRFDDSRSLRENLLRDVLRPEGFLFDEVAFLLRSELSNPATYNSLLAAVARGAQKLNDIALEVGVDSTTANKYLSTLRELRLVEREVPMSDPDPLRSRRGTYRIADRFLQFHFRHLQPHLSLIHAGRGAKVLEQFVDPDMARSTTRRASSSCSTTCAATRPRSSARSCPTSRATPVASSAPSRARRTARSSRRSCCRRASSRTPRCSTSSRTCAQCSAPSSSSSPTVLPIVPIARWKSNASPTTS